MLTCVRRSPKGVAMKIVNEELQLIIQNNHSFGLELGCGPSASASHGHLYRLDIGDFQGVDIVADLNSPLDLIPTGIVSYVYSRHTLEHIHNLIGLMEELHRILEAGGTMRIIVPHFSNNYGYWDPTHVRQFGIGSMYYFSESHHQPKRKVPSFYSSARFRVTKISVGFYREDWLERLLAPVLERLINRSWSAQLFYERRLSSLFPASEVEFILQK
jgi:predicted SAM-dependent methyltransferase